MRNILSGTCAAVALTLTFAVPRIGGVETWKIVLALTGVGLFVLAAREPRN